MYYPVKNELYLTVIPCQIGAVYNGFPSLRKGGARHGAAIDPGGEEAAGPALPRQLKPNPFFRRISIGSTDPLLEKGTWTMPTSGASTAREPLNS